jgi:hypothetical protein
MSVYFIACGGFVKVGFSRDPERRVARLFTSGSRYTAPRAAFEARGTQTLLGTVAGSKNDERMLHLALDDYAAGCEWFVDEPPLREYLASLTDDHRGLFAPLVRDGGPAWETLPNGERGGSNVSAFAALDTG